MCVCVCVCACARARTCSRVCCGRRYVFAHYQPIVCVHVRSNTVMNLPHRFTILQLVFELTLIPKIHDPSFVRADYCSVMMEHSV